MPAREARIRTRAASAAGAPGALAALLLLVLSGSFEAHTAVGGHALAAAPEVISVNARHARQEAHFETSELEIRSACPVCLLHHSAGLPLAGGRAAGTLPSGWRMPASRPDPAVAPPRAPGNPRAPPIF